MITLSQSVALKNETRQQDTSNVWKKQLCMTAYCSKQLGKQHYLRKPQSVQAKDNILS